ncbi:MAG: DNA polymerase III subunit gamma and tau [Micromonosporaceae bacterium]
MALALYRKYRPRTFAEVIGQEHVTEPLTQALRSGRLHHAYLFSGPRGCGKTSSARILARSLNCAKGPTPEPCGECDSCRALALDGPGSIDVIEIDAASHGGVDDARDLRERAIFAPVASRFKVYVIDEAHMVSTQGFNALLKLVEEPPDYVTFVFATTEPEKVLGTIKSRTHHYPFRLVPPSVLRPYLESLCQQEGVTVEPAVFPLVVRAGGGSVRDSLSVLDQLIAGASGSGVSYQRAVALLGVTDVALIDEMVDALAAGDGGAAFATVDRVADAGHDARRFAGDLLERLRDLIVLQQVPDATANGIIDAPADQLERMTGQASRMGPATLSRLADIVHNGLIEMRGTTAPRLLLELIVARMLLPGAEESTGALLQRVERMERRLGAAEPSTAHPVSSATHPAAPADGPGAASVPVSAPPARTGPETVAAPRPTAASGPTEPVTAAAPSPPVPAPAAASVVASSVVASSVAASGGRLDAAAVRRVWDEVLTMVRRKSQRAWAVVREATVREVEGDTLVLVFRHGVHATMLSGSPELLIDAVAEVLGGSWSVRCEVAGEPTLPGTGPRTAAAPEPLASAPGGASGGDWPTPARLGGADVDAGASADAGTSAGAPARRTSSEAPARGADAAGVRGSASRSAGGTGARSSRGGGEAGASSGRGGRGGRAAAARSPSTGSREAVAPAPSGSAPAARAAAAQAGTGDDGFDPDDEPLDEPTAPRLSSEEQALRLLTEQLGAERIGES